MAKIRSPDELKVFRNALYAKIDIERARKIAENILFDDAYLSNLKRRACAGVLNSGMEQMLWAYVFGKPQETVNVNVNNRTQELKNMSDEELAVRASKLSSKIVERSPVPDKDGGVVH